jgi:protein-S-isoprenylcysteine O-methyltransferase Ste14
MIARWLPALFLLIFIGLGVGWRAWLQWGRFGSTGVVLFRSGRWIQHLREASLLAVVLLLSVEVIAAGMAPARIAPLVDLGPVGFTLGCLLGAGGLALMVRAQLEMGASWRIGIDERSRPGLVTHGLYRWTRNPIYLAMFLCLAGLLLLLPTWITLAALLGGIVGVRQQVREEEAHLLRAYGDEYRAYAARVARFVPGIG